MAVSTQKAISINYWQIAVFFIILSKASAAEYFDPIHDPTSYFPSMRYSRHGIGTGNTDGKPCTVEYEVTEKKVGKCVKLDHNFRGCSAGNYMHPFHPDCL